MILGVVGEFLGCLVFARFGEATKRVPICCGGKDLNMGYGLGRR